MILTTFNGTKFLSTSREGVRVMVFNATFNNILAILQHSVFLVQETEVPGENH